MASTDYLKLSEHKIFEEFFYSLPKNLSKTTNILTVHDQVLFTWDFGCSHVLSLNIKFARSCEKKNVVHQKLVPIHTPLFSPENIIVNEISTLLAVFGPNGIMVLELPNKVSPYGAFDNNKEVIFCRSYSFDERLLSCNDSIEVRQVKFHPGSAHFNHILALTSDNMMRLYHIRNNVALNISVIPVGEKPNAMFPGSKTAFLECFGETAVDFDFGQPEIFEEFLEQEITSIVPSITKDFEEERYLVNAETQTIEKIVPKQIKFEKSDQKRTKNLIWPIYILRGNLAVYIVNIDLHNKKKPMLEGPLPLIKFDNGQNEACSIACFNTTPQIVSIALSNGTIYHSMVMDIDEDDDDNDDIENSFERANQTLEISKYLTPTKGLIAFENVELELGLLITADEDCETKYKCPIFLHKDDSKLGRYYATHNAGVHSIEMVCVNELHRMLSEDAEPTNDIFSVPSKSEYLICTKIMSSEKSNPVIGFSIYYEPSSIIALLNDGSLISLAVLYAANLPNIDDISIIKHDESGTQMSREPFDVYIQKILKKTSTQPILKWSSSNEPTLEQCYEILQRAVRVFREEYFKNHTTARVEFEKRVKTLTIMKENQQKEIERMMKEKDSLQEKAGYLAEKYEDIKDQQDELTKRCENLLMLVNRKKSEPSHAEKDFMKTLELASEKVVFLKEKIDNVKKTIKYQEMQVENWKSKESQKLKTTDEKHLRTIHSSLQDSSKKISEMIENIKEYKKILNLK